jgi:hypothetical protein
MASPSWSYKKEIAKDICMIHLLEPLDKSKLRDYLTTNMVQQNLTTILKPTANAI